LTPLRSFYRLEAQGAVSKSRYFLLSLSPLFCRRTVCSSVCSASVYSYVADSASLDSLRSVLVRHARRRRSARERVLPPPSGAFAGREPPLGGVVVGTGDAFRVTSAETRYENGSRLARANRRPPRSAFPRSWLRMGAARAGRARRNFGAPLPPPPSA
jgi:hypothetical protein